LIRFLVNLLVEVALSNLHNVIQEGVKQLKPPKID